MYSQHMGKHFFSQTRHWFMFHVLAEKGTGMTQKTYTWMQAVSGILVVIFKIRLSYYIKNTCNHSDFLISLIFPSNILKLWH